MRNILITGGTGYIGSHIAKVVGTSSVIVDLAQGSTTGRFVQADITNPSAIDAIFAMHQFDTVIHLAALIEVGGSVTDPAAYYQTNVIGTLNLLNAMVRHNVRKIIYSSSCAIYGPPKQIPMTEEHPVNPLSPYAATKLAAESAIRDYAKAYDLSYVIFRYFNAAGASPADGLGEQHEPETHLIPRIIRAILDGTTCTIFGTDYPTPDGTCIRDYIHVKDIADAHLCALTYLATKQSATFNLGTGQGISVHELLAILETIMQTKANIIAAPRRPGDSPILVADPTKAHTILSWQAEHTIRETLQDAVTWELMRHQRSLAKIPAHPHTKA